MKKFLLMVLIVIFLAGCFSKERTNDKNGEAGNKYLLTLAAEPSEGGDITAEPYKTEYTQGEEVVLKAAAAKGYVFKNWGGANGSEVLQNKIVMNGNKEIKAVFAKQNTIDALFEQTPILTWDFEYIGSFNTPVHTELAWVGTGIAYRPPADGEGNGSLFIVGHDQRQKAGEISIPEPVINSDVTKLPTAVVLQEFKDITEGNMKNIRLNGEILNENIKIGGLLVYNDKLYGNSYAFYSGANDAKKSHFTRGLDLAVTDDFKGMFTVGDVNPGMTAGYMCIIPENKRVNFGGEPLLTGQMGLSIISRSSYGPSLHTFSPDSMTDINVKVNSKPLVYYTQNNQTLGSWDNNTKPNPGFNMMSRVFGAVYPENSEYIYLIGRTGIGIPYYGAGTTIEGDPSYDPADSSKGTHAWPYVNYVWVYSENDLKDVYNGQKQPWEITPVNHGMITLPYYDRYKQCDLAGATYDFTNKKLYIASRNANGSRPIIHVYRWKAAEQNGPVFVDRIHFGSKGNPLDGLTVNWRGVSNKSHKIRWGYTNSFEKGETDVQGKESYIGYTGAEQLDGYLFEYTFPQLIPDSEIYYSISDGTNWSNINTFKTAGNVTTRNFTFLVGGDVQHKMDVWGYITNKVSDTYDNINFIINTGDFVDNVYKIEQWDGIYKAGEKYLKKYLEYRVVGNHDLDGSNIFFNQFTMPENKKWYSFEYGDVLFVFLLSNADYYNKTDAQIQYEWLKEKLRTTTKKWKVVTFHRPFFAQGVYGEEMTPYFDTLWKTFDDYGVDVIFNGHLHYYMRTKPINRNVSIDAPVAEYGSKPDQGRLQIITGNMGSGDYNNFNPLQGFATPIPWYMETGFFQAHYIKVDVEENKMNIYALNRDNIEFDRVILQKSE